MKEQASDKNFKWQIIQPNMNETKERMIVEKIAATYSECPAGVYLIYNCICKYE